MIQEPARGISASETAWSLFLVLAGTVGSAVLACATPFAALAAIVALTLPPRLALVTVLGAWLGNQAIGYHFLGYPLTASSLAWGPVLGGAAIAATAVAIGFAGRFDHNDVRRALAVFGAALVVQQGLVLGAGLVEGTASFEVAAGVSGLNLIWFAALAAAHRLVSGLAARAEPAPATAR